MRAASESSVVVDFVSESSIRTVTVATDRAGEVTSTIRDQIGNATDGTVELVGTTSSDADESIPATEMHAATSSESDTGSGPATKTNAETKIETEASVPTADGEPSAGGDVGLDLDLEAGVGLG